MKLNRRLIVQVMLPIALTTILLFSSPLAGCKATPTSTPTATKTPTLPPLSTPTAVSKTSIQATATATSTPTPTRTPAEPTATPTLEATNTPTPFPLITMAPDINPLTGLKVDPAKLQRRPLGIKIPNYPAEARPQSGLSRADVVVEHEAEAYLTRFMAIFLGNDANPEVGPVRSVRLVDGELMPIFKAVLVASGGHMAVKLRATENKPWAEGYKRIICPEDPFLGDGDTLRRVPKEGRRLELTMYSDTGSLWDLSTERGINEQQDFGDMWVFSEVLPPGGTEATNLKIVYKPDASEVEYRYDAESNTYKRFDLGDPLIDELTGEQIAPTNILVLRVHHADTDIAADTHDPNHTWYSVSIQLWGEGPAKLLRDGKVYEGKWVREDPQGANDRLIIVDSEGKQIPFAPGTTWIQVVRLDGNVQIE